MGANICRRSDLTIYQKSTFSTCDINSTYYLWLAQNLENWEYILFCNVRENEEKSREGDTLKSHPIQKKNQSNLIFNAMYTSMATIRENSSKV